MHHLNLRTFEMYINSSQWNKRKVHLNDGTLLPVLRFSREKKVWCLRYVWRNTSWETGTRKCLKCLWKSSECPQKSPGVFGYDRVFFENPSPPWIKISHQWFRKIWKVYKGGIEWSIENDTFQQNLASCNVLTSK